MPNVSVLVAEDNDMIAVLLCAGLPTMVEKLGSTIDLTLCKDGKEAMNALANEEFSFNLVILDVQMPFADGEQVYTYLRKLPQYKDTPVILHSAHDSNSNIMQDFRQRYRDKNVRFIVKGNSLKDLAKEIHNLTTSSHCHA